MGVGRRDDVPARRARQARHRAGAGQAARVQERRRPDHAHRVHARAPRGDRPGGRRRRGTARCEVIADARGLTADAVRDAGRRSAAVGGRGAGRRAGRPARLPRRGVRRRCARGSAPTSSCCSPTAGRRGASPDRCRRDKDFVALVDGHGEIVIGRSRTGPRGPLLGSDTVCAALRAARENDAREGGAVPDRLARRLGGRVRHDLARGAADLRRPASRSSCRWARSPARAATTSPARPTSSSRSRRRSPGRSACSAARSWSRSCSSGSGSTTGAVAHGGSARMYSLRQRVHRRRAGAAGRRCSTASTPTSCRRWPTGRGMSSADVDTVARGRIWSGRDAGGQRTGRPARRPAGGGGGRARAGGAALRRAGPARAARAVARPARPADVERGPARGAAAASGWGDLAELAAALGLPVAGPLRMPGIRLPMTLIRCRGQTMAQTI